MTDRPGGLWNSLPIVALLPRQEGMTVDEWFAQHETEPASAMEHWSNWMRVRRDIANIAGKAVANRLCGPPPWVPFP